METQVAIVGGGLAGLQAARLLHRAGIDFVLFEARDRLGGRVLTVDGSGRPAADGFDLGPSWIWPRMQPAIGALVEDLGLAAFAQASDGDAVFERTSHEAPIRYRDASEPPSMRLVGGTSAIVHALVRGLPREKLLLQTRVQEMAATSDGLALTFTRADAPVSMCTARKAIVALPPRLIEATISFSPGQDPVIARLWRETSTWMAPTAKFVAIYDAPFWRDAGLSGAAQSRVGPMAEIHDASTASGSPALFGFLGLAADQRDQLGQDVLKRACLGQLSRLFGPKALDPRATHLKDWSADPLTATDSDRAAAEHLVPRDVAWVSPSWSSRLALAGSETSPIEPGYLNGAVIAAERAVAETLRGLRSGGI